MSAYATDLTVVMKEGMTLTFMQAQGLMPLRVTEIVGLGGKPSWSRRGSPKSPIWKASSAGSSRALELLTLLGQIRDASTLGGKTRIRVTEMKLG